MDINDVRDSGDELDEQDEQDESEQCSEEMQDEAAKVAETSNSEHQTETGSNASHKSLNQGRNKSRSITPQNSTRTHTHPPLKRNWRSANAFINFVQDYKKDYADVTVGGNIFQICGERWKVMSDEQKQPYIDAAQTVKRLKQRKSMMDSSDQLQKKTVARVSKKKTENKRKESNQKKSKANKPDPKSNSDTDTATTTVHSSMSDADSF